MRLALVLILTLLGGCASSRWSGVPTTYYVATNGSDRNAGTEAAPWKTIGQAVDSMDAGDTAIVKGGVYMEEREIHFKRSGTASALIRLISAPGESPVIDFASATGPLRRIFIQHRFGAKYPIGHIAIEGFEIRNGRIGIHLFNAHDLIIRRNWIHHAQGSGILGNGKNVLVERNIISHNGDFEGCAAGKLHAPGRGDFGTICNKEHGLYLTGTNWTVINNLIYDNLATGIQVAGYPWCERNEGCYGGGAKTKTDPSYAGASHWLIANNTIAYNGYGPGIIVWQAGAVNNRFMNNILYENGQKLSAATSAQGISFYNCGGGHTVQNNVFYATGPGGVGAIGGTADWQSKYTESGNIVNTGNPNFVNAPAELSGTPNFHLQAGSPAIDAGVPLSEVSVDMAGDARPSGSAYDAGAFEFKASPDASKSCGAACIENYQ
ncbi:MAG: right-handed parallel beta-helix repeat-containing protein [Nitrospira sp.]|nr:right-handed parallel beta-helix repeat-containing protein [Nitrospira sp.]